MKRRPLIVGGATAAVVAGLATAWWQDAPREEKAAGPEGGPGAGGEDKAAAGRIDVWSLAFLTPNGDTLSMNALRGRPLLLNFWATWCGPCVTEMPLLDRFAQARAAAGWQVLALAIDEAEPVRRFLAEHALHLSVGLAGTPGLALSRALGNDRGGLPFTVAFGREGRAAASKVGAVSAELLEVWATLLA